MILLCSSGAASGVLQPKITAFKVKPSSLSSAGGEVAISAKMPGVATCTVTVTPAYGGLPSPFSCGEAIPWRYVVVPPNTTTGTLAYSFTLTAKYDNGATLTSKAASLKVAPSPAHTYVALGDSYSAGEGNPGKAPKPWVDRTGKGSEISNGCDRSAVGYPPLVSKALAKQSGLPSMSLRFLACSGATTEDVWNSGAYTTSNLRNPNDIEWQQLQDSTDLNAARIVTITIGGNDIDFADIIKTCTLGFCGSGSPDDWVASLGVHISTLQPILESTYRTIERAAPHAALYVVGYPDIFPPHPTQAQLNDDCPKATDTPVGAISASGIEYLAENEIALATAVEQAAHATGAHYVNPNSGPHSFLGHDICATGTASWFNLPGATGNVPYSYHPNQTGQQALAKAVIESIQGDSSVTTGAGGAWAVESTVDPSSSDNELRGVSCISATACTAVGASHGVDGSEPLSSTLVERWNGSGWSLQGSANRSTSELSINQLNSVSCTAADACTAVGYARDGDGSEVTLAESWDGSAWTIQPTPNPTDAAYSRLQSVSCTSASACVAVGFSSDGVLAEEWDGTSWSLMAPWNPGGSTELASVSCAAPTSCTAVGTSPGVLIAERWDGTHWTDQTIPTPPNQGSVLLSGVSCPTTGACTAVGGVDDSPLVERWDGSGWSAETTGLPSGGAYGSLDAIACSSPTACTAAGGWDFGNGSGELAENWNGISWVPEPAATPPGDEGGSLQAISCSAPTACSAVGAYSYQSENERTLAERYELP